MPAPTVGSAKNGMRPTKNSASAVIPNAPAMRTNRWAIGSLRSADATTPAIDQTPENPRTDHDTSNLTRVPEFGSIADSSHSHVTTQIVMPPWRAGNSQAATKGKHEEQT